MDFFKYFQTLCVSSVDGYRNINPFLKMVKFMILKKAVESLSVTRCSLSIFGGRTVISSSAEGKERKGEGLE